MLLQNKSNSYFFISVYFFYSVVSIHFLIIIIILFFLLILLEEKNAPKEILEAYRQELLAKEKIELSSIDKSNKILGNKTNK